MRTVFTLFDAEAILKIPLCNRRVGDFWAWSEEKRGHFSVSSAYRMLARTKLNRESWLEEREGSSDIAGDSKDWNSIWKIKVPSNLMIFIWRLARHSIPSGEVLHRRNMATTATCPLCGAHDTCRHALLSCPMS